MPVYDYQFLLQSDTANTSEAVTTNEINFGVTSPGVNKSGAFGMHVIVTTTFTTSTSVTFWILQGAATGLTTSSTKHTGMDVPLAQLVKGAHFFVPMGSVPMLQFACGMFTPNGGSAGAGKTTIYFGDAEPLNTP